MNTDIKMYPLPQLWALIPENTSLNLDEGFLLSLETLEVFMNTTKLTMTHTMSSTHATTRETMCGIGSD